MALDQIYNNLAPLRLLPVETEPVRTANMLSSYTKSAAFREVLHLASTDMTTAEQIAENSEQHQNGFLKIKLLAQGDEAPQIRLHIWDNKNKKESSVSDVHNHTRDFCSVLLVGSLISKTYCFNGKGELFYFYSASNRNHKKTYLFEAHGIVPLCVTRDLSLGPGETYYEKNDALHQIIMPPEAVSATLFMQGPIRRDFTFVLTQSPKQDLSSPVQKAPVAKIVQTIKALLKILEKSNDS